MSIMETIFTNKDWYKQQPMQESIYEYHVTRKVEREVVRTELISLDQNGGYAPVKRRITCEVDEIVTKEEYNQTAKIYQGEVKIIQPETFPLTEIERLKNEWLHLQQQDKTVESLEQLVKILKAINKAWNAFDKIIDAQYDMIENSMRKYPFLHDDYQEAMYSEAWETYENTGKSLNRIGIYCGSRQIDETLDEIKAMQTKQRKDFLKKQLAALEKSS
ncbi:hypothetical protein ACWOE8_19330 [Enterococcus avium]